MLKPKIILIKLCLFNVVTFAQVDSLQSIIPRKINEFFEVISETSDINKFEHVDIDWNEDSTLLTLRNYEGLAKGFFLKMPKSDSNLVGLKSHETYFSFITKSIDTFALKKDKKLLVIVNPYRININSRYKVEHAGAFEYFTNDIFIRGYYTRKCFCRKNKTICKDCFSDRSLRKTYVFNFFRNYVSIKTKVKGREKSLERYGIGSKGE